ncbi:MAG: diguanylate cyclase [Coxiella sp. (in: Bacteria)]|nr:MAG: diguanylate cyclase [Coxiella sp. (in: g-proteobacteria)]
MPHGRIDQLNSLYRDFYENSPDMYASIDPETRQIRYCNDTVVSALGYESKEALINNDLLTVYHPDCHEQVLIAFKQFQQEGQVDNLELALRKTNGDKIPVILKVNSIHDDKGDIVCSVSCWRDISDQKALDTARQSHAVRELRYRTILNSVTDGWWDWNLETNEEFLSPSLKKLFGYEDHELPNHVDGWQKIIFKEDFAKALEAFNAHIENGDPYNVSVRYHHKDGSTRWVMCRGQAIQDDDGEFRRMVGTHTDITALKEAELQLDHIAHHDMLTGLPNRAAFIKTLTATIEEARAVNKQFALLYIDLDDFKKVNDALGHHHGDDLLKEMAKRLTTFSQEGYFIARIGGDEFTILIQDSPGAEEINKIAQALVTLISERVIFPNRDVVCTPSIGIAIYPSAGSTPGALLMHADMAMYQAKALGRKSYQHYSDALQQRLDRRDQLERYIRCGIEYNEFYMEYQPIVSLKEESIVGVEALLRWKHPKLGLIEPSEFIPLAENIGFMPALGDHIIEMSCREFSALLQGDQVADDCMLSINLSSLQFSKGDLQHTIHANLSRYAIAPSQLLIEVTESSLIEDFDIAVSVLRELSASGINIAMDDFGKGYSSLSYLKQLPIDYLKIDQSFIRNAKAEGEDILLKGIISLGQALNLKVIAEGVETQQQLDLVRNYNCDLIQGFYFHHPMPLDKLMAIFETV